MYTSLLCLLALSLVAAAALKCECSDCGYVSSVTAGEATSSCETSGACYIRVSNPESI